MSPVRRRPIACPIEWPNRKRYAWWLPVACPPRARTVLSLLFPSLSGWTGPPAGPTSAGGQCPPGWPRLLGLVGVRVPLRVRGRSSRWGSGLSEIIGGGRPLPWPTTHHSTPHSLSLTARHQDMSRGKPMSSERLSQRGVEMLARRLTPRDRAIIGSGS